MLFRKCSFSVVGTSFFSYGCKKLKTNSVFTLLNRFYATALATSDSIMNFMFLRLFFLLKMVSKKL